jgi:lipopolysaccharide/colanic/teichoic acid biosynthesis glycosyltransferase
VPAYVAQAPRGYRAIAELRPGLTDWASLAFRDEEEILHAHASDPGFYPRVVLPRKLALARLYHRKRSLGLDLSLIAATVALVVGLESVMHALVGPRLLARARAGLTA